MKIFLLPLSTSCIDLPQGSLADYEESVSLAKEAWKAWAAVRISSIHWEHS